MYDENYWYGPLGWPGLRRRLLRLALHQAGPLREHSGADPTTAARHFVESLARTLERRAREDPAGPWSFALPLLADVDGLAARLRQYVGDAPLPAEHLAQILKLFLEDGRRQQQSHRQRVWNRLNRLSLDLAGNPTEDRCREPHFRAVLAVVVEKHPEDHSLPHTLSGVGSYFLEFCEDCHRGNMDAGDLLDLIHDSGIEPDIDGCLQGLQDSDAALHEVVAVQDCRDLQRPREELERYSLGALKLVGSFRAPGDNALWALIQAPDGIVHRLGEDGYLGANHGRVVRIRESGLELVECVANPEGGWEERQALLRLSE